MENVRESPSLVSGDQVVGARVYDPNGETIGAIEDVMLDKASGTIIYAVMSYGGFLGFGKGLYPLPWRILKYDRERDGYVVDFSKADLSGSPGYPIVDTIDGDGQSEELRVDSDNDDGPLGMI